mmetsp:Transcript_15267/g.38548  ORF Transcript_15267/g.38548 Transcript_15267/m.38548 type:complete len:109 (-) Transcript_15267:168-494(-)
MLLSFVLAITRHAVIAVNISLMNAANAMVMGGLVVQAMVWRSPCLTTTTTFIMSSMTAYVTWVSVAYIVALPSMSVAYAMELTEAAAAMVACTSPLKSDVYATLEGVE